MTIDAFIDATLNEQRSIFARIIQNDLASLCDAMLDARAIFLYGVGRNGLMLQAFAMRLAHLGLDAHFVGQLSAPPADHKDLLIAAVALGSLPTADAVIAAATNAGARVAVVTARPTKVAHADLILELPAQTMADRPTSPLPLGGAFELSLHLLCEALTVEIARRRDVSDADLRARHANLL